ncbi:hypothetical protein RvY_16075 [Ramazzottius varieornatus]|uniref:Thioredoxin-like fold domain-containing protein n=1 Tax=Ramazzottius varieornatus TaxID=947166 RepID=A0A1D1VYJ8_RAMVA|nr:hypothetical protein RvY_16075 [Ramazzottius varieornatus]
MADDTNTLPIFRANFELLVAMKQKTAAQHEEVRELILDHIKHWSSSHRVISADFEPGLDWFNVTRPLSLHTDLRGKVVVLDFFTYCCVNCQHVLSDLHELERLYSVEDGLVIVGVHSPKFEHEKDSSGVLNAVLRSDIEHPVVNDAQCKLWQMLFVNCWPTLVVLGPEGEILFILIGEDHRTCLFSSVKIGLEYFKSQRRITPHSLPIRLERNNIQPSLLSFPSKLCTSQDGSLLAIADTGHHRIVISTNVGLILDVVGSGEKGFEDGAFKTATFSSPQGLAWHKDVIYVADAGNHAIREIDLLAKTVTTLAGNGQMGNDEEGGAIGIHQSLNTPWDVCLVSSQAAPPYDPDCLLIAMSGCHQIWLLALRDGVQWYKRQEAFPKGLCLSLYGSGQEEHRNNMYGFKAGFAQPSGLCWDKGGMNLFVADAESSTVRVVSLTGGGVKNLVGGSRDPTDLFAFGDVDAVGGDVRLQHPLHCVYSPKLQKLFVADSYNHKIKAVDVATRQCQTIAGAGRPKDAEVAVDGATLSSTDRHFDEPNGIALVELEDRNVLFIADTNNHCIKAMDLSTNLIVKIPMIYRPGLSPKTSISPVLPKKSPNGPFGTALLINMSPVHFLPGDMVTFNLDIWGMELDATSSRQQWQLSISDSSLMEHLELWDEAQEQELSQTVGTLPSPRQPSFVSVRTRSSFPTLEVTSFTLFFDMTLVFCDKKGKMCLPKQMRFVVPCRLITNMTNTKKEKSHSVDLSYVIGST